MTGPPLTPQDTTAGLPSRILSPDEYGHAQTLSPQGIRKAEFPAVPKPYQPKPDLAPIPASRDAAYTAAGIKPPGEENRPKLTGPARILTQYVAAPLWDHPILSAASVIPPVALYYTSMMVKDVTEYAAQKVAELSLQPTERKLAEADPNRIKGEQAAVEATLLAAGPLIHEGIKRSKGEAPTTINESLPKGSGAGTSDAQAAANAGLTPVPSESLKQGQSVIKAHVDRVVDSWKTIFAPASRSTQAAQTASILRASTGEMARTFEQASFKLDEFRRAVDPLPEADKLGFIDAIEGGKSQPSPEFQGAADTIRETLDTMRDQIRGLGTGKLDNFIENYFPHIWADPEKATDAFAVADVRAKVQYASLSDEALAQALEQKYGDITKAKELRARTQGGRLKALGAASDEELAAEYKYLNDANAQENVAPTATGMTPTDYSEPHVGMKQGAVRAAGRVKSRAQSIAKVEAELQKRGIDPSEAYMRASAKSSLEDPTDFPFGSNEPTGAAETINLDEAQYQASVREIESLQKRVENTSIPEVRQSLKLRLDALKKTQGRTFGRRPFEGSGAFLKRRTIPTTAEGLALGLQPVTTNPVDLTLLKLREMQRYYMAHSSLHEMQDAGLVKYVPSGGEIPNGYTRINDKITTVFGPREGAVKLPEGTNIAPEDVRVPGMRIMGEYWAPEPVARVVNNYLSPGLRGNAIYDAYRGLGNSLNQAQLGLSAFHLMFTSMDASVSRAALGLEYITGGELKRGFREMLSAPIAPITNLRLGARVRELYLDPHGEAVEQIGNAFVQRKNLPAELRPPPDMQALANAVAEAGGRIKMDSFYQNSAPEKMIKAWKEGEYGKAIGYSLPAMLEFAAKPIMEHIVPLQKLGVFGDLARKTLDAIPPETPLADRRIALQDAWNSVDNRMGQLVYDNLFWSKMFKDAAMASVRSVGWNIGTIRELGGGIADVTGSAADIARGKATELSHRAAYVIALPMTVAMYGAVYQYLRTGEGPQEMKDYFYPRTGEKDADGNPERVQIASYMKDFFAYSKQPWETVKHKMAPVISTVYEMLQNEDFYGDMIRNPDDPFVQQIAQEAGYVAKQVVPFSFRNMSEQSKRGDQSTVTKLGSWFGITPAPRSEVRTEAQNRMMDYLGQRRMSGATPEDAEARQTRSEILRGMRGNSDIKLGTAITNAIERHQLTAPDVVKLLKRAGLTPAQEQFKRLTLVQAVDVFKRANRHEKELFAEALLNKVMRASETASQ